MTIYLPAAAGPHFQILLMSEQATQPGTSEDESKVIKETR